MSRSDRATVQDFLQNSLTGSSSRDMDVKMSLKTFFSLSLCMGLLQWVVVILAVSAPTLVAKENATQLSIVFLVGLLAFFLLVGNLVRSVSANPPTSSGFTRYNLHPREVNDSLYELHKPVSVTPSVRVIFFHGLPLGDLLQAHLSTWESGDRSCIWPHVWLVEQFVDAEILSVSYSKCLMKPSVGNFDISIIGENLISDLIDQLTNCPIVLVGHCVGGLVIKQLCLQAHDKLHMAPGSEKDPKLEAFLENIRGIFYYGTPHHGSPYLADAAEKMGSPLFEYVKILSKEAARMNSRFDELHHRLYPKWQIHGLGESKKTKLGRFRKLLLVPEASARAGCFRFRLLPDDHYSICKPQKKSSTSFRALVDLLDSIISNWKEEIKKREETRKQEEATAHEESQPGNFQYLPEEVVGIDFRLEEVTSKLENKKKVGLVGMGGVGKTTLAKAVFNSLSHKFEYSCFVPDVKLIKGTEDQAKEAMWKQMHYKGRKVENHDDKGRKAENHDDWSTLRGKRLLLVLDDIAGERDITILSYLANHCSPESRYIATARDHELLKLLDVFDVLCLDDNDAKELFRSHAFGNGAIVPLTLATVMVDVLKKCEGLPLALEVLGRYLRKKEYKDWEQVLQALDKGVAVTAQKRLWAVLRLSYDGLEETEKKMFLDATTFFNNGRFSLGEAKAAWRKAYEIPCENLFWRTLVDRCLVNDVEDNETIQVHEQVQALGRMIVIQCNNYGPCNVWECNKHGPRRVWEEQMALKLLQTPGQVKDEEFHSLRMERSSRGDEDVIRIASQTLPKLSKLRFLEITASVVIDGSWEADPSLNELLALNCVGLPIFNLTLQSRLVVLKLSLPGVENLPTSIGQLSSLEIFVLLNAEELKILPGEIGHLSRLETLDLRYCESLQNLPETFGNLRGLRKLYFTNCFLDSLPESFGQLSSLIELELINCKSTWSLIPFGRLMELQYLKIGGEYLITDMDSMPDSIAKLRALRFLVVCNISMKSIPDYINLDMPSLHTLELARLPYVKVLPDWLGNNGVIPLALSLKIFEKQEGNFCLTYEEDAISSKSMVKLLHSKAMTKAEARNYKGALEDLCPGNLGAMKLKWKGFLLQERGILKRLIGDLRGAFKDLSAALEFLSEANDLHYYAYDCWKHRGFVNFSLNNLDGAEKDGTMARKILSRYGIRSVISPCLGDEPVVYMHFILKGLKEIVDDLKDSAHSQVMEMVKAEDFRTALATWNDLDVRVSGYYNRGYFLQERGILKRMAGDLHGALEDLTAALEINENDYECLKHQGYVKHLLGEKAGARIAAERCKAMKAPNYKNEFLGALPVEFLGFHLT